MLMLEGVVCDLMGWFLIVLGELVLDFFSDCVVGLYFDEVCGCWVIVLVGGESKVEVIFVVLCIGVIIDFVVDEIFVWVFSV